MNIPDDLLARLADPAADVVFFPVRHHSPTAARVLRDLAEQRRFKAVLVEGPSDFNPHLAELHLPHQLPIAVYSHARTADGGRHGAFYPLCEHSPEWQAVAVARDIGATLRFVDLPWADILAADASAASNRFGDGVFARSTYISELCQQVGVDDFNSLWDTMFEIDATIDAPTYLRRAHLLCGHMRLLEGDGLMTDRLREAHMVAHLRDIVSQHLTPAVVVLGGAHCLPLAARFYHHDLGALTSPETYELRQPSEGEERGIALTPYSFERLDALTGYNAGMPHPAFYQQVWTDRLAGRGDSHRALLQRIVQHLRDRKQAINTADLIAAESTARALADLRGHACVWRTDLVDGLTTSFIKEDLGRGGRHPLLDAVASVLRGGRRGMLAPGTTVPAIVSDIREQLAKYELVPDEKPREIDLDLDAADDRITSRVLHRLRLLEITGFDRVAGADLVSRSEMANITERWRLAWSPDFEARSIEASRYGPTLSDAASSILGEKAAAIERDVGAAALLLLEAGLAGLVGPAEELRARVAELIRGEGDFFGLCGALGHLLYLYRYDTALGTAGADELGDLLREAYSRALRLLEGLGRLDGRERDAVEGVVALRETFERCGGLLDLSRDELLATFARVEADRAQSPTVRGASLGARCSLSPVDDDDVRRTFAQCADPDRLGDFLAGLFALAREQVQRRAELLPAIHAVVAGWSDDEFLHALPALRLAFTTFTPREKHHMARTLRNNLGLAGETPLAPLTADAQTAAAALAFEGRLFALAKKHGVRGGVPT